VAARAVATDSQVRDEPDGHARIARGVLRVREALRGEPLREEIKIDFAAIGVGQLRQWPSPFSAICAACSASKRAWSSSGRPPSSTNAAKSFAKGESRSSENVSKSARRIARRAFDAHGQSISVSPSSSLSSFATPAFSIAARAAGAPSTAAGSICATLRKSRDDGEYGLNLFGSALNIACIGLIATACPPHLAACVASDASAVKSPMPPSPLRRKPYTCAATPHSGGALGASSSSVRHASSIV
jgi:hypothetical protein